MFQYFLEAAGVLMANRTRSMLTALGLIIGVMAVIAIQVLGAGLAGAVNGVLGSLSDRSFVIFPNNRQADFSRAVIRADDLERAKTLIPNVVEALPLGSYARRTRYGQESARLRYGPESNIRSIVTPLRFGSAFTAEQVQQAAKVVLLSSDAYDKLHMSGDPTGTALRAGERRYLIIGVLAKTSGFLPQIGQADAYIPYTTWIREFAQRRPLVGGRFLVNDVTSIEDTERAAVNYFQNLKHGRVLYQSIDRKKITKSINGIFTGITVVVAMIGAVSLLVAGIGILNIMLVSVAERTREIGLRKAIGATSFQVLAQFFIEALLLSAIGCGVGLVLGLGIGALVNEVFLVKISGVIVPIPWLRSVLIATGFATLVTLVFGTYPAYRAASLDPIEALRYE